MPSIECLWQTIDSTLLSLTCIWALGLWGGYGLIFALMDAMWACERHRRRQTHA